MKPTITLPELLADIASGKFRQMVDRDYYLYGEAPLGSLIRSVQYDMFTADILVCPDCNELLIDVYTYCETLDCGAWRWTIDGWKEMRN